MDLTSKLRFIQEGHSIEDINSGNVNSLQITEAAFDEFSLFTESITTDVNYMMDMLQESERPNREAIFNKVISMLIDKIRQLKWFIQDLFTKKKKRIVGVNMIYLEKMLSTEFKPYSVDNALSKIITNPTSALSTLKGTMENFEDALVQKFEAVFSGYNREITKNTNMLSLKILIWKQVTNSTAIGYDHNVTQNVIDFILVKRSHIDILTHSDIKNIVDFAENFYDLWRDVNSSLTFYESNLAKLKTLTDENFQVIRLICQTILQTLPEILRYVDSHISKLIRSSYLYNN